MSCNNNFFIILRDIKKTVCLECEQRLSGVNISNIKRHYRLIHKKDIFNESKQKNGSDDECVPAKDQKIVHKKNIFKKSKQKSVPAKKRKLEDVKTDIDKKEFLKCCVGLVAVKNFPFEIFDDEFFKVLISPHENKFNTCLNSENIVAILESYCVKIQENISRRVKNKILSLKFDIATVMDKIILGISIQYIKDFEIFTSTIGMIRLYEIDDPSYLKEEILDCLNTYQIDIRQIYCITIDNGGNMLKVGQLLQNLQEEQQTEDEYCFPEDNNYDDGIHEMFTSILPVVRCAAYSIQISAYDVFKDLAQQINESRYAIMLLRKTDKSEDTDIQMPILDNKIWWISTYEMYVALLDVSPHIEVVLYIDWEFARNFVAAFKPLALFAKQLQKEQYIIGDFYRDWLCCEIELEELFHVTPYASLLHKSMHYRKNQLFKNEAFLAAIYLDPRFNFKNSTILSEEQRTAAIEYLVKYYGVLISLESAPATISDSGNVSLDIKTEFPTTSAFTKLEQRLMNSVRSTRNNVETHQTFKEKLMLLASQKKLPLDTDVLNYWKTTGDNGIIKIVEIALSVPATQVSVERIFCALPVVSTKLTSNLSTKVLSNLLITNLNFKELTDH